MLYLLTGSLPWAVTANYDMWELAHGRQPLEWWSVTSSGVGASDLSCHRCTRYTCKCMLQAASSESVKSHRGCALCAFAGGGRHHALSHLMVGLLPGRQKCTSDRMQPCRCDQRHSTSLT